jgi:hypothetical protein
MPSLPGSDEVLKALLTAAVTAVISRLSGIFEVLSDPNSPQRTLEGAKQTLGNIEAGARVSVQLNQLPPSPRREQMQAKLDELLLNIEKSRQHYSDELLEKRNRILKVLALMRLNMPQSVAKGVLSFVFYTSLVLTIQALHLYLMGIRLNGFLIWVLSAVSIVLWIASGSTMSLRFGGRPREQVSKKPVAQP